MPCQPDVLSLSLKCCSWLYQVYLPPSCMPLWIPFPPSLSNKHQSPEKKNGLTTKCLLHTVFIAGVDIVWGRAPPPHPPSPPG